jgi:hypothetical protein
MGEKISDEQAIGINRESHLNSLKADGQIISAAMNMMIAAPVERRTMMFIGSICSVTWLRNG